MTNSSPSARKKILHIISGDLWAGAEAQAHTLLKNLKPLCDVSVVLLNDGELARRLRACDIGVTIFDETKLSTWNIFSLLRSHIQRLQPDAVHTHRQKENILGAVANATTIRARCIRTAHGAPEFTGNWKTNLQRQFDIWVGNHIQDSIISVSDGLKTKLSEIYPQRKIHVVHNGVDADDLLRMAKVAEFRVKEPHKNHIGIIGRLVPVKRVDIFLNIAALFKEEAATLYHFHIIGDGPLRHQLETQATDLKLGNLITFHGNRTDVPSCIKSLNAIVMCSDHEAMPMVALEALALETPFLTHIPSLVSVLGLPISFLLEGHLEINSHFKQLIERLPHTVMPAILFDAKTNALKTWELY